MKFVASLLLLASGAWGQTAASCAAGPTPSGAWDTSGNGMLNGMYNFRYVQYTVGDSSGNLSHAAALFGVINFSGNGTYQLASAMKLDSNSIPLAAASDTYSGTYSIGACGFGFISNPLSSGDSIWGLVSQTGVFVGSTTETQSPFNDLFIGAPAPTSATTLQGSYSVAYMNFPDGYFGDAVTAGFQMTDNSRSANILMYQASSGSPLGVTESMNFSFVNGVGTLTFPQYGQAISRTKTLYVSPDGNFVFGGGADAFDMFVGVRTQTSATVVSGFPPGFAASGFNGLYYQAGIDDNITSGSNPSGSLQTYYGAFKVTSNTLMNHQRIVAPLGSPFQGPPLTPRLPGSYPYQPFNYTYVDAYSLGFGSNVGYTDAATGKEYVFGANGASRLGFGVYPKLGISVALQAPSQPKPPSSSPYLYAAGVLNATSDAPYTSGIAPGEVITLYGSNLTSSTGLTTVTINGEVAALAGTPASGQVSVIVPTDIAPSNTSGVFAQIQLTIGASSAAAASSNIVWAFVNNTAIGVLTQASNGLGDAYAENSSSVLVTPGNLVAPAGTLNILVTGLGNQAAPPGIGNIFGITPPSSPTAAINVTIGGMSAPVTAINPSPGNAGLSVVTVTVPAAAPAGDLLIGIAGLDSTTAQATVEVK